MALRERYISNFLSRKHVFRWFLDEVTSFMVLNGINNVKSYTLVIVRDLRPSKNQRNMSFLLRKKNLGWFFLWALHLVDLKQKKLFVQFNNLTHQNIVICVPKYLTIPRFSINNRKLTCKSICTLYFRLKHVSITKVLLYFYFAIIVDHLW